MFLFLPHLQNRFLHLYSIQDQIRFSFLCTSEVLREEVEDVEHFLGESKVVEEKVVATEEEETVEEKVVELVEVEKVVVYSEVV